MSFNVWVDLPLRQNGASNGKHSPPSLPEAVLRQQQAETERLVAWTKAAGMGVNPTAVPPSKPLHTDVQERWATTLTELLLEHTTGTSRQQDPSTRHPMDMDPALCDWIVRQCSSGCSGHEALASDIDSTLDGVVTVNTLLDTMRAALATAGYDGGSDANPPTKNSTFEQVAVVAWRGAPSDPSLQLHRLLGGSGPPHRAVCALVLAVHANGTVVQYVEDSAAAIVAEVTHDDPRPGARRLKKSAFFFCFAFFCYGDVRLVLAVFGRSCALFS